MHAIPENKNGRTKNGTVKILKACPAQSWKKRGYFFNLS